MKKTILLLVVLVAVLPFVFAKAFASSAFYGVQPVQQPVQRDNTVITSLPRWNSTGAYGYAAWHGIKPNPMTGDITFSQMWGPRIMTATIGNTTQYSYTAKTLPGAPLTGITYNANCSRGQTKCGGKIFSKCEAGIWMIAQTCRRSQECTSTGCVYA